MEGVFSMYEMPREDCNAFFEGLPGKLHDCCAAHPGSLALKENHYGNAKA